MTTRAVNKQAKSNRCNAQNYIERMLISHGYYPNGLIADLILWKSLSSLAKINEFGMKI